MDMELGIKSAGVTTEDNKQLNVHILNFFEENVCKEEPYCGTTLLPLEKAVGIIFFVQGSLFGALMLEKPAGRRRM